jgi:predicted ferric reductase
VALAGVLARRLGPRATALALALSGPSWPRPPALDTRWKRVACGLLLIGVYVGLCLGPLLLVSVGRREPRRPFLVEFSVALGYVGLSMMVLQFALVSRIKWLAEPFGIDLLHKFHREVSFVALAFIFAHPVLLFVENSAEYLPLLDLTTAPWRARFAVVSILLLLLLFVLSIWRRLLRLSYEAWKMSHGALSVASVLLALAHMDLVGHYMRGLPGRLLFDFVVGGILFVLVWSRIVSPVVQLLRPWQVVRVIGERGRAVTMVVEPIGHRGLAFKPGQFAWVTVGEPPFGVAEQHPFSFSSPPVEARNGRVWLTIARRGDWTRDIAAVRPGTRVYLDGPYGRFSIDHTEAPGYVFIAGGVGITPLYSMIAAMCLREDPRPVVLFYASRDWESVLFREQIDALSRYMPNLRVVHVLRHPHPEWRGEGGYITTRVLLRHLPAGYRSFQYFLCASEPVMDAVQEMLVSIGVPASHIDSERFAMV